MNNQMMKLDELKRRILEWFEGTGNELDFILDEEYLEPT